MSQSCSFDLQAAPLLLETSNFLWHTAHFAMLGAA